MSLSYISVNQTKAFRYSAVQAFDYYTQPIDNRMVLTLRVVMSGGDQWYEGHEATSLYGNLLQRAKDGNLGT